ncbi:hypothetical protein ABZP36_007679 [Zizania latifolia]
MRTAKVLLLAALVAACLAHGAESTAARRSLTFDDVVFPAGPRSDSGKCWELLLTLGLCRHDLLASFLTGCPVPRACCRAICDVDDHCGPFTRAFVGSLLPHSLLRQCAATTTHRAPNVRAAPPRVPAVSVANPRVPSGGARPPPSQDTYTSMFSPPPRAPKLYLGPPKVFHRGTHTPPPMFETSVQFAPPDHPRVTSGGALPPSGQDSHTSVRAPPPRAPRFYLGPPKVFPRGGHTPPPRSQTSVQFAPPDDPRVSGGTPPPPRYYKSFRLPPDEEAEMNAPLPPPNTPTVFGGTPPPPRYQKSFRLPPDEEAEMNAPLPSPNTPTVYGGTHAPPTTVPAYGGAAGAGGSEAPKPKVIRGGGVPPVPVAAEAPPRRSPTAASPSSKSLPHGTSQF